MTRAHRAWFARFLDWVLLLALMINSVAPVTAARIPLSNTASPLAIAAPGTPTATATATPSATSTRTPTATATPTNSVTPSRTLIATKTFTPSPTATSPRVVPTAAVTATPSATVPATRTSTATLARTPTMTMTATVTRTPTITITATLTRTPTISATATLTRTPTITATATLTHTSALTTTKLLTATVVITETDIDPILGGDLRAENGAVRVQFPPNAATQSLRVRFSRQVTDFSKASRYSQTVVNRFTLTAVDRATLTTEVKQFQKPITLTVQYDPHALGGLKESSLMVVYWDTTKKSWQPLPSRVDTTAHTVTALTPHFTDFGLATAPTVNTYLPNLQGFQTSLFTGSASASYDLNVPAGRGGLAPKLNLSYSSQVTDMMGSGQQASYVGAGWSLSENYIARGNPFSLVLNGAGYDLVLAADGKYHTVDEHYWLINYDKANDQWQVTTNDGTVYSFGTADNSRARYWTHDGYGGSKQVTYNWYLASVTDTHGNQITYSYLHERDGSLSSIYWWVQDCPNRDSDMALYPQLISYNGGLTQVGFYYSARSDYNVTDGYNSGLCTRNPYQRSRLDRVDISTTVNSTLQLVRSYALTYDYSTFPGVGFDHGDGTGASGRLTLTKMTQYGTDGVGGLALPTNVFTYTNNRLSSAEDGIGGKVAYAYDTFTIGQLPGAGLYPLNDPYSISRTMSWKSNGALPQWGYHDGHGTMDVYAQGAPSYVYLQDSLGNAIPGAVYTYTVETLCAGTCDGNPQSNIRLSVYDGSTETFVTGWVNLTGYSQIVSGTWTAGDNSGGKIELRIYTKNYAPIYALGWALPYTKHRVISKTLYDGVSSPITYTYSYTGAALNDVYQSEMARTANPRKETNTEFRGHSLVSVTDPTGARTDNYFLQDDVFAGHVVTTTQFSPTGAKLSSTINTNTPRCISVLEWQPGGAAGSCTIPTIPAPTPTPTAPPPGSYDDTDSRITYSGSWTTYNNAHVSQAVGSSGSFTFYGAGINFNYYSDATQGTMNLSIDGVNVGSINQSTPPSGARSWNSGALAMAVHTLVFTHASGYYANIDSLSVLAQATPTPPAPPSGWYDDTDSHITYSGSWSTTAYSGTHVSLVPGSSGSFSFYGAGVVIQYGSDPSQGTLNVAIDGNNVASINQAAAPSGARRWQYDDPLQAGVHTVTFTHASGSYANIDGILVLPYKTGNRVNFGYVSQTQVQTYDGQSTPRTTRTDFAYDGYGNQNQIDEYGDSASIYRRTIKTYYAPATVRITNLISATQVLTGTSAVASETHYFYDENNGCATLRCKGDVTHVDVTANGSTFFTQVTKTYDGYGNVLQTIDANNHPTATVYDPNYHLYPINVTNPAGQTITNTYNYRLGQIATTTDANNAMTSYTYDALGRTTAIKLPLEQSSADATVKYQYTFGNPRSMVQVQVRNDLGGTNPASYQNAWWFYDGLGRVIQQQSQGLNNSTILANTSYDPLGHTWRVSNPYTVTLNNGGTYWTPTWDSAHPYTEHQYDALGREIKTITADPAISQTMAYNQWTTALMDANGHQHQTIADAFGRVIQVKEFNQGSTYTTDYAYNILNQLYQVQDAASPRNITTMAYDKLGRKTGMVDPDLGTWSYGYDNAGNLTRQTDNKQQTTCMYYDTLNRLVGKNYRSDTACPGTASSYQVSYTYDQGTNGIGRRTSMSVTGGATTTWVYDLQGRTLSQTDTIDANPYTTNWTYDAMDRVRTMTYPVDNETVTTTYNSQGLPATLSGLSNYVTASWYNPAGQLTSLSFGNLVTTTYTYDLKSARLTQLTTTGGLQNLQYQYDNVGNIKTITDNARGETTTFTYDDLDRLLSASIAGVYSQGWQYNAIGNITQRTGVDAASFTYADAGHKHAVTQVGSNTYAYDANGNMTYRTENGGTYFQTFDAENRVSAVISSTASTHMVYNADGQRVRKTEYTNQAASFSDTFDSANTSAWTFSPYQTVPFNDGGQNVVKSAGTGTSFDANFYRKTSLTSGKSVSVDFKVDGDCSYLHLAVDSNDGGVYNRLAALASCGGLVAQYYNEAHPSWGDYVTLIAPLKFNTWYRVTLRIDDTNKFKIEAYERDGGTASGSFVYPMGAGKNWTFHSWIYRNNAYLDNYVERTDSVRATSYVGNYYEVTNGAATKYYYFGTQRVAMRTSTGVTYLHGDNLGSTGVASNSSGALASRQTYYAFGAMRTSEVAPITSITDYNFTGQKLDASDGLMYYNARYYDATIGRFIQPDSIVPNLYDPQYLNRYSYVRNNPVRYTDLSGHGSPLEDFGTWLQQSVSTLVQMLRRPLDQPCMALECHGAPNFPTSPFDAARNVNKSLPARVVFGPPDKVDPKSIDQALRAAELLTGGSPSSASERDDAIDKILQPSIHNPDASFAVLGSYPEYTDAKGTYFSVSDEVLAKLGGSDSQQFWEVNKQFLDDMIAQGKPIKIVLPDGKAPGKGLVREKEYLDELVKEGILDLLDGVYVPE